MCCIFGFIKWSLSCIQRSLTFVLGFWVLVMMLYAIALALGAGVAFGYDYSLAEYAILARDDVRIQLKRRQYATERLYRRSGRLAEIMADDDELKAPVQTPEPFLKLAEIVPTWIYKGTPKYWDINSVPSSARTLRTSYIHYRQGKKNIVTRTSKKATRTTMKDKSNDVSEVSEKIASTSEKDKSKKVTEVNMTTPQLSSTSVRTFPTLNPNSLNIKSSSKANRTETTTSEQTKTPLDSRVIRLFVPKSTLIKWRPTRPQRFFYKTPMKYSRRKTIDHLHEPDMVIRIPSHGKHKGLPMRHWNMPTPPTKAAEPDEGDEEADLNMLYF